MQPCSRRWWRCWRPKSRRRKTHRSVVTNGGLEDLVAPTLRALLAGAVNFCSDRIELAVVLALLEGHDQRLQGPFAAAAGCSAAAGCHCSLASRVCAPSHTSTRLSQVHGVNCRSLIVAAWRHQERGRGESITAGRVQGSSNKSIWWSLLASHSQAAFSA